MALPTSNLQFQHIENLFGGSHPISLNEYYGSTGGIPTSGAISMEDFRGAQNLQYISLGGYSHQDHYYNSGTTSHTVGTLTVPRTARLYKVWIRGSTGDNISSYLDRLYVGSNLVWDGTLYDVSTSGDGTEFTINTSSNYAAGNYGINMQVYSSYESYDRIYINQVKFYLEYL